MGLTNQAMKKNPLRLDAADLLTFKRELEFVDTQMYEAEVPENVARMIVPTQPGIPEWARAYTWRMMENIGKAKIIGNSADDLPRVDVGGSEKTRIIKPIGDSYAYSIFDIKAASQMGIPLDAQKAIAARIAIENEVDRILSTGDTLHNLEGILSITGVQRTDAATKSSGGLTVWDDNATAEEIVADVFEAIDRRIAAMNGGGNPAFRRFTVVLPDLKYSYIARRKYDEVSGVTILEWLEKSKLIAGVMAWHRLGGAGSGDTDRMLIFVRNPIVVAGIVPIEFTTLDPEKRNLEYVIDCYGTCGGVVLRYLFTMEYVDGI